MFILRYANSGSDIVNSVIDVSSISDIRSSTFTYRFICISSSCSCLRVFASINSVTILLVLFSIFLIIIVLLIIFYSNTIYMLSQRHQLNKYIF